MNTVKYSDAKKIGFCARGCREWCAQYGFDWAVFRSVGLPIYDVAAVGDAMADKLIMEVQDGQGS
jgi:hypothetical protein